jgi:hypothetical protein
MQRFAMNEGFITFGIVSKENPTECNSMIPMYKIWSLLDTSFSARLETHPASSETTTLS